MPLFASSSGVQINGGQFYDIAGNMNVHSALPSAGFDRRALSLRSREYADEEETDDLPADVQRPQLLPYEVSGLDRLSLSDGPLEPLNPRPLRDPLPGTYHPSPHPTTHAIQYPSTRNELGRISADSHPIPTDLRRIEAPLDSNVTASDQPVFPWENPHEPRINIEGGTFIGGNVNRIERRGEAGLHILYRASANDASHDSGERYPQPQCHPQTRTKLLKDLLSWSSGDDPRSSVLWLHGPAGAGKSAIAQSLCQSLQADGRLGGSFFFKRGHVSRGNANKLFPTLAYQLAALIPELKRVVSRYVEDDPSIVHKFLSTQLQRLIMEPYRDNSPAQTFVVVIDGLDECEGRDIQQEILRSIGNSFHRSYLPLRFLIASRPEPHIVEVFREPCLKGFHRPLNVQKSFQDVRTYLQTEFIRIHQDHHETMGRVPTPWPSASVIEHLVEKSSGYFVYASTVIKFVDDKDFRPTDRLDTILGIAESEAGSGSPFSALDQLYAQILSDVPARPRVLRILTVIASGLHSALTIPKIEQLLELRPGDVRLGLRGLQSVIKLPSEDEDAYITVHHASFLDFLGDPTRSYAFCVAGFEHRTDLARQILKALSHMHTDPSLNRNGGHIAWDLNQAAFKTLTSALPSPGLLSLLRSLNPDFLFHKSDREFEGHVDTVLAWLKKAQPLPQDLIQRWEDYRFMRSCDNTWSSCNPKSAFKFGSTYPESQRTLEILLRASPHLSQILLAYRAISHGTT
ncbi:hypothetical protein FB451DRAFT_685415 [Mycena latifolia]|nr:hypothetical protein FB451DRAFT_685415 [Mycena latifolia]